MKILVCPPLTLVLLEKGYTVHGIIRRSSSFNTSRLHHLYADVHEGTSKMFLHYGDLTDTTNLVYIISQVQYVTLIGIVIW